MKVTQHFEDILPDGTICTISMVALDENGEVLKLNLHRELPDEIFIPSNVILCSENENAIRDAFLEVRRVLREHGESSNNLNGTKFVI